MQSIFVPHVDAYWLADISAGCGSGWWACCYCSRLINKGLHTYKVSYIFRVVPVDRLITC